MDAQKKLMDTRIAAAAEHEIQVGRILKEYADNVELAAEYALREIDKLRGGAVQVAVKVHTMHTAWGVFWWAWGAWMVVTMLLDPIIPDWWWFYAFGVFLAPEVVGAVIANRKGDTFSQSLWTLAQHGLALRLFSCGVGLALGTKTWTLYFIIAEMVGAPIVWWELLPWTFAMLGLNTWLFLHFLYTGDRG